MNRATREGVREAIAEARVAVPNHDHRLAPKLADYAEDLLDEQEAGEPTLLDEVLDVMDLSDDRVPVSAIAEAIGGVDPLEVEAAVVALLHANLCGEVPAGYFFTDERDPEFAARAERRARRLVELSGEAYRVLCGFVQDSEDVEKNEIFAAGETWDELRSTFPLADYGPMLPKTT